MIWPLGNERSRSVTETAFSKFIREASSEEKKRVYAEVLQKATDSQVRLIEQVKQERARAAAEPDE
jgi:hypothetical protein